MSTHNNVLGETNAAAVATSRQLSQERPSAPQTGPLPGAPVRLLFHSPRIPPNTGNAIRIAAGAGCELHLAGPLGFDLSEPHLRRAGLDYHDLAHVVVHDNINAAFDDLGPARVWAFSAHGTKSFADVQYEAGDILLFGPEPTGLSTEVLEHPRVTGCLRIPMLPGRRSMNLANAAAVAVYEAWRQHGFPGA